MRMESLLLAAGAAIFVVLGSLHLRLTLASRALHPRNADVRAAMAATSPRITSQTSMWRAWVGFNATHSLGAIVFGLLYGYMALAAPGVLFGSPFLLTLGLLASLAYVAISWRCFFRKPLLGTATAAALYAAAWIASLT